MNFDVTLYPWGPNGGTVGIDTEAGKGYFEHKDGAEGGGLWFDGLELVDYDGVYELPKAVEKALRDNGYTVE